MNTLIKNVTIITSVTDNMVINDGFIYVEGNIIKHAGKLCELPALNPEPVKIIDGRGSIAMPGFVNSHTHSPMTLLRNYGSDLNLQEWLFEKIFPKEAILTDDDVYYGSMLAIAEMISSGTTAFADMYYKLDNIARAVTESGIRSNIAFGPFSNDYSTGKRVTTKDFYSAENFIKNWNDSANGRIKNCLEVHSTYLYDIDVLPEAAAFAKEKGLGIHIHLHETGKEIYESMEAYGRRPIQICKDVGLLDVPVIAAHCVHLTDEDIEILSECPVSVIHNPTSNLKLASGIARIPDIIKSGINVAIGTDGASSNNNLNMVEETHLTAILHKGVTGDPRVIDAGTALRMATVNGAKAIGYDNLGVIAPGYLADIILFDTDGINFHPVIDPVAAIAYSSQGNDVHTVMINGEVLYEGHQFKTLDMEFIKYKFNQCIKRIYEV